MSNLSILQRKPAARHGTKVPFWTDERVEQLLKLADGSRSAAGIAAEIGATRGQVIGKLGRLRKGRLKARHTCGRPRGPSSGLRPHQFGSHQSGQTRPRALAMPAATAGVRPPTFIAPAGLPAPRSAGGMPFLDAAIQRKCLFFAGDPYGPDGPDMPVCGHDRFSLVPGIPPYCRGHLSLRHQSGAA